jgi:hypothetical protein
MIGKLLALLRNTPSSTKEARLEDALRYEAKRMQGKEKEEEAIVAKVVARAKRRPRIRQMTEKPRWASVAPGLLGAAALVVLALLILRPANQSTPQNPTTPEVVQAKPEEAAPETITPVKPATAELLTETTTNLSAPFSDLAFNPLEPATKEWQRFAGDTRDNAESLLATAKSWAAIVQPNPSIETDKLLPPAPDWKDFSPYGNELERLRNDLRNALEALPFLSDMEG